MHIVYQKHRGIEYACVMESHRVGKKIEKKTIRYLGRVLDRDRGIYKTKDLGVYCFDFKTQTVSKAPEDFVPQIKRKNAVEKLIVDFGDAFFFNELIKSSDFQAILEAIPYGNPDSLKALLCYYILDKKNNVHASTWWEGSYARILFPRANLTSQRISDMLQAIGQEHACRAFFKAYLNKLGPKTIGGYNILIDSTGLPNSIRFPCTAISNHNGIISEEVRLIYVVQQRTRLPIYMRYVAGNIVDTTTLTTTIEELKAIGVNTKFAILDAGYMTEEGIRHLLDKKISFITRCPSNRSIYKELTASGLDDLESDNNLAVDQQGKIFNGREVYVKHAAIDYAGAKLHAYICKDKVMEGIERKKLVAKETSSGKPVQKEGRSEKFKTCGVFVLLSSRQIRADLVLDHYYVRQDVEQVFDITKNYTGALPLCVEKEETFRGHLLLTFIATIIVQNLQNKIRTTEFTLDNVLSILRNQKAKIFDNVVIPSEAVKKQNDIYKLFNVKVPVSCPYAPIAGL